MKAKILEISDKLKNNEITEIEAQAQFLILFDVSKRCCYYCGFMATKESFTAKDYHYCTLGNGTNAHIKDPFNWACAKFR